MINKIKFNFRGGIHPPQMKITAAQAIEEVALPEQFIVPMLQHNGVPAVPTVQKGDLVKKGQLIGAIPEGKLGADIHAPTSGKVTNVALAPHPSGKNITAVYIEPDGEDAWADTIVPTEKPLELSIEELVAKIKAAGIIGMGGAAYPTHAKLLPSSGTKADTLIINGAECEPGITADHRLMVEKSQEIALGIQILAKILGVSRTVLLIEDNKRDAMEAMDKFCAPLGIEVLSAPTKYPEGAKKQVIYAVTGKHIPRGRLASSVGAVVKNVATSYAVYEACYLGRPLISRVTTVSGSAIVAPGNLWIRIGTPFSHLINHCGGLKNDAALLLHGGPMMGTAVSSTEMPTIKSSNGIMAFGQKDLKPATFGPCLRCGRCVEACPHSQEPFLLGLAMEQHKYDLDIVNDFMDHEFECVECGSCTYVCPSRRPLVEFIRQAKQLAKNRKDKK